MVFEKIKSTIGHQLGIGEDEIQEGTTFGELGIDSLEIIEVIIALEEEFDIEIPNEDIADIKSLEAMTKYIQNKLDNKMSKCECIL